MKWKGREWAPGTSCRPTTEQGSQCKECTPWLWLRQTAAKQKPETKSDDRESQSYQTLRDVSESQRAKTLKGYLKYIILTVISEL